MQKKLIIIGAATLVGFSVLIVATRMTSATKTSKKISANAALQQGAAASTEVPLYLLEKKPLYDSLAGLIGTIKGNTIELTFNGQEERLAAIHVEAGQRVKKGQLLFELNHTRSAARKSQAESALARAKALHEAGGATILDLQEAQAAFDIANKDHADTFIYAPANGSVSQINKHLGETIGRNDVVGVLISSEGRLLIETGVVESQLEQVREGQKVLIEVDAFAGKKIQGVVAGVSREVTTTGRTGTVYIGLPSAYHNVLRPGLSARCEIITVDRPALLIPRQAYDAQTQSVGLVGDDGKGVLAPVVLGHITRDHFEIVKGLKEGDSIVADIIRHPVEEK